MKNNSYENVNASDMKNNSYENVHWVHHCISASSSSVIREICHLSLVQSFCPKSLPNFTPLFKSLVNIDLLLKYTSTRSLGALQAPTSSWRPFKRFQEISQSGGHKYCQKL